MRVYFDSSAILSILLREKDFRKTLAIWGACEKPCSSILLKVETVASIRRIFSGEDAAMRKAREIHLAELLRMLSTVVMLPIESEVARIVETEEALSRCRSLDALHIATALYLQKETWEPIAVCTLDSRMRATAETAGLNVFPD